MLESNLKSDNVFVTLTIQDDNLTWTKRSDSSPSLNPADLRDWLKRFRRAIAPLKVRYFAIGEYGDVTQRPHYHLALFGYPNCTYGNSRYSKSRQNCCASCDTIRDTWGLGHIFCGDLSINSAQYVAGYVTKKLTHKDDPRLLGRHPEFARMSLKPGIGADFMHDVASALLEHDALDAQPDVPHSLQHGSRSMPLGRYLTRRLRELIGRDPSAPQETIDAAQAELQPLRLAAFEGSRSFKAEVVSASDQKVLNAETRMKIRKTRRDL